MDLVQLHFEFIPPSSPKETALMTYGSIRICRNGEVVLSDHVDEKDLTHCCYDGLHDIVHEFVYPQLLR